MFNTREKKERSLGVKLFLKPHRCSGAKCVTARRPVRPGMHGRRRRTMSEFATQLQEKQRFKFSYGLREASMRKLFRQALKNPSVTGDTLMQLLERRLDNVVFRLGIAPSRSVGRQLVSHGHIMVGGRKVTIPSYSVKTGDVVTIRSQSSDHPILQESRERLSHYEPPAWLAVDPAKLEGKVLGNPKDFDGGLDVGLVVDYYAKQ